MSRARSALWAIGPCALAAATFAVTLRYGVLRDDAALVFARGGGWASLRAIPRSFVEGFWPASERATAGDPYYRPLVTLLNALDLRVAGPAPWAFHLVNLLLHAGSVLFVFRIARRLSRSDRAAALAAALFALHPAEAPSVAWISGRTDLLCALATLAALDAWLAFLDGARPLAAIAAALAFALALLAKETALAAPAVAIVAALALGPSERRSRLAALALLGSLALGALYLAARRHALAEDPLAAAPDDLLARLPSAAALLAHHVGRLLLPRPSPFLPAAAPIVASRALALAGAALAVAALLAIAALVRHRDPSAVGATMLFAFLLTVIGLVPIPYPAASWYGYLPAAGLALALAPRAASPRALAPGLLAIALALAVTARALPPFASVESLCRNDLTLDPDNVPALVSCAQVALDRGEGAAANRLLARAFERAPDDPVLLYDYALSFSRMGDVAAAERFYRLALAQAPALPAALTNLGLLLIDAGRCDDALPILRRARAAAPDNASLAGALVACDNALARFDDARADYEDAQPRFPSSPLLLTEHADTLLRLGRLDEAARAAATALALDPHFPLALRVRSAIDAARGRRR